LVTDRSTTLKGLKRLGADVQVENGTSPLQMIEPQRLVHGRAFGSTFRHGQRDDGGHACSGTTGSKVPACEPEIDDCEFLTKMARRSRALAVNA